MASVGIIANPAAGKDIRRLVAQGRFVPNQEKVNILKRILAGLDAVGVERVVMMPDMARLGNGAMDGGKYSLGVEFVDMTVFNAERDSVRAAGAMSEMGVGSIITLGGDGTNQAVAKGCGDVPLVPVSTGTNNVFPVMAEGTLAGLAAGLVAQGLVDSQETTTRSKRMEVYLDGELRDIALVDVAISRERFVGARAIWGYGHCGRTVSRARRACQHRAVRHRGAVDAGVSNGRARVAYSAGRRWRNGVGAGRAGNDYSGRHQSMGGHGVRAAHRHRTSPMHGCARW